MLCVDWRTVARCDSDCRSTCPGRSRVHLRQPVDYSLRVPAIINRVSNKTGFNEISRLFCLNAVVGLSGRREMNKSIYSIKFYRRFVESPINPECICIFPELSIWTIHVTFIEISLALLFNSSKILSNSMMRLNEI